MRLAPASPWAGVPEWVGTLRLEPVAVEAATEVLPVGGADVSVGLERTLGVRFPGPGRSLSAGGVRVLWFGRETALVLGARVEVEGALCVDQSDGWAALQLSGAVRQVLARLCPLDLRDVPFPAGAAARTLLNHVEVCLTRVEQDGWLLLVPRSMTGTVLEEIVAAAEAAAGR